MEIVAHTACVGLEFAVGICEAGIVLFVYHVVDQVFIVAARELPVVELHEDDQSAELTVVVSCGFPFLECLPLHGPDFLLRFSRCLIHLWCEILLHMAQIIRFINITPGCIMGNDICWQ